MWWKCLEKYFEHTLGKGQQVNIQFRQLAGYMPYHILELDF